MRILICDDEKKYSDLMLYAVQRWKSKNTAAEVSVDIYNSSEDMLETLGKKVVYDLAFLDIQFPGEMNGLQLAHELRLLNEQMIIVFISNYEEYAVDGYKVNALRFFFKPIQDEQVFECLDLAYHQWQLMMGSCLLVESKQQMVKLPYKSIYYIESQAHYLEFHLINQDNSNVLVRQKLADLLSSLPQEMFIQCHRSCVVNLLYVQRISKNTLTLTNGIELPVSSKYRESLLASFRLFFQGTRI